MTYQIIPIAEEHIEGFHAVLDFVCREKKYLTFVQAPPLASTREFIKGNITSGQTQLVVVDRERVVGWCDIISSPSRDSQKHTGVLGTGLLPEYRGKGIGGKLLRQAIQRAEDKGLTRIELYVNADNLNAIALYKKLGFETEGLKRKASCLNGQYRDVMIMAIVK